MIIFLIKIKKKEGMYMELNPDERRKRLKVWISEEERALLEAKAEHYGYKHLSEYIRDSAIYENVTMVDLKNKNEILKAYSDNTQELKKIAKEFRHMNRYATQLSSEDLDNISLMIVSILKRQKEMLKLIDNKLDLDVWKELNHNRIVEDAKKCL